MRKNKRMQEAPVELKQLQPLDAETTQNEWLIDEAEDAFLRDPSDTAGWELWHRSSDADFIWLRRDELDAALKGRGEYRLSAPGPEDHTHFLKIQLPQSVTARAAMAMAEGCRESLESYSLRMGWVHDLEMVEHPEPD